MDNLPNKVLLDIFTFLKCKDHLPCRLVSKRWNLLTTEQIKIQTTISSRIEAIYFLQLSKSVTVNSILTRIRLAMNNIPIEVLADFAQQFTKRNIELTLFRQFEKTETEISLEKAQVLLETLQGITYLKIDPSTQLLSNLDLPFKTNFHKFPTFSSLTKIVWNGDSVTFLLAILRNAPALGVLEVTHWYLYDIWLQDAPMIMKHLPLNALLTTTIPSTFTLTDSEVVHISEMCQFVNKISNLTLQPLTDRDGFMISPTLIWKIAIMQLLESQRMSLKFLDIRCQLCFIVPKLMKLEFLQMQNVSFTELNPSLFPSLRELAVRGDLLEKELLGANAWTTVRSLELLWGDGAVAVSDRFLSKVKVKFPNLKILTIAIQQFPELRKYCRNNTLPLKTLRFHARKGMSILDWTEFGRILDVPPSDQRNTHQNDQLAQDFWGLVGLKTLQFLDADEAVQNYIHKAILAGMLKGSIDFKTYKNVFPLHHNIVTIFVFFKSEEE